jgi:hypothetical protein
VPYAGEVDVAPPLTTGPDIVYSPSHIHVDGDVRAGWFFGFVDDLASWSCFGFLHNLDRFPMVVYFFPRSNTKTITQQPELAKKCLRFVLLLGKKERKTYYIHNN